MAALCKTAPKSHLVFMNKVGHYFVETCCYTPCAYPVWLSVVSLFERVLPFVSRIMWRNFDFFFKSMVI